MFLNELAFEYLNRSEFGIILINYALLLVSFAVGGLTHRARGRMRRAIYFVSVTATTAVVVTVSAGWLSITNWFGIAPSVMLVLTVVSIVTAGFILAHLSQMRSRDAKGDPSITWMGIAPVFNIYLMLVPAHDRKELPKRSAASRFVADPLLVFLGFVLQIIPSAVVEDLAAAVPTVDSFPKNERGLESLATEAARQASEGLPVRIDSITMLSAIEARGITLVYRYDVETDMFSFSERTVRVITENMCGSNGIETLIDAGLEARLIYSRSSDGGLIEDVPITSEICARM